MDKTLPWLCAFDVIIPQLQAETAISGKFRGDIPDTSIVFQMQDISFLLQVCWGNEGLKLYDWH